MGPDFMEASFFILHWRTKLLMLNVLIESKLDAKWRLCFY